MVVPYAHVSTLEDLDAATMAELMALVQLSLRALREAYAPQGFNVGMNIGEVAGAGIAGHIHLHVLPRWGGDTNYMTTVSQTRVIPELLDQTYERLRPLFDRMSAEIVAKPQQQEDGSRARWCPSPPPSWGPSQYAPR
jgi:ATP adenylyltransferase